MNYVEKKIKSGRMLEAEFYPVFPSGRRIAGGTSKSQAEYNRKQSLKNFIRIINANFDENSYKLDPTYDPANAPLTEDAAKRDVTVFIRRLRRLCARRDTVLKYAYAIEEVIYKRGIHKGRSNWHFHFFLDCPGVSAKEIESLWDINARVNCMNYQPDRFGQKAAARYVVKDPKGAKRYVCSRNLKKPTVKTSKPKYFSKRKIERLVETYAYDSEYWEKKYPGYKFIGCQPKYNEYNGHWYIYTEMRQIPELKLPPKKTA